MVAESGSLIFGKKKYSKNHLTALLKIRPGYRHRRLLAIASFSHLIGSVEYYLFGRTKDDKDPAWNDYKISRLSYIIPISSYKPQATSFELQDVIMSIAFLLSLFLPFPRFTTHVSRFTIHSSQLILRLRSVQAKLTIPWATPTAERRRPFRPKF
jgi:hypothetical protein